MLQSSHSGCRWCRRAPPFLGQMRSAGGTFCVVTCDSFMRLSLRISFAFEGSRFGWLRRDPGRRLGAASTARLASFAEQQRSTGLRRVGRCPSVRLPVLRWRFCRNDLLRMLCSPECPSFRVLLLQEPPCCKFQALVAGYTDACTSLCTGAKHLRSAQFYQDTPPCNQLVLLLSLAKCAALEERFVSCDVWLSLRTSFVLKPEGS